MNKRLAIVLAIIGLSACGVQTPDAAGCGGGPCPTDSTTTTVKATTTTAATTTTVKATTTTAAATTTTARSTTTTSNPCPPEDQPCTPGTVNVTTTTGPTSTTGVTTTTGGSSTTSTGPTSTTTTQPGVTTTTRPGGTTTTLPATFSFGGATTVCIREVPTIRITFASPAQLPSLVGQTGTLTMAAVNGGAVLSTQPLVYAPGTTTDLLYPGTRVNADGTIADVPGWNLNAAGFWVRDPADAYLRDGILLTYTINPTATATVTYPPESSACANPDGPFPPGVTAPPPGVVITPGLPPTL